MACVVVHRQRDPLPISTLGRVNPSTLANSPTLRTIRRPHGRSRQPRCPGSGSGQNGRSLMGRSKPVGHTSCPSPEASVHGAWSTCKSSRRRALLPTLEPAKSRTIVPRQIRNPSRNPCCRSDRKLCRIHMLQDHMQNYPLGRDVIAGSAFNANQREAKCFPLFAYRN